MFVLELFKLYEREITRATAENLFYGNFGLPTNVEKICPKFSEQNLQLYLPQWRTTEQRRKVCAPECKRRRCPTRTPV